MSEQQQPKLPEKTEINEAIKNCFNEMFNEKNYDHDDEKYKYPDKVIKNPIQ